MPRRELQVLRLGNRRLIVVAAPNPYKGSLGSPAAAHAMAEGIRAAFPGAEVREVPVADGGEDTVAALVAAGRGELIEVDSEGPLGDPLKAAFGLIEEGRTAVVELAAASGLTLISKERRDPRVTSSRGFGRLLAAARKEGVTRIIAGIGGSATNDAGAGMAQALGYRLLDDRGEDLPSGGAALARLASIDPSGFDPSWREVRVEVACDVTNPLTGPEGATAVYGPQKGATPEMVRELDGALAHFAAVVERDLGVAVADLPGAGAAGGAGAGLVAFLGARLTPGAPLIVAAAGLDRALEGATAVLTGEGRVDVQTVYGKGPAEVIKHAREAGLPVAVIAGSRGQGAEALGVPIVVLVDGTVEPERKIGDAAAAAVQQLLG